MRDGVCHTVRESLDFTLKGNRAERVQIVNVSYVPPIAVVRAAPVGLFQRFRLFGDVFDVDPAQGRGKSPLRFGQRRSHDVRHQG